VDVRALAALLLVLVALPARAARLTFVCRASAPGAPARVVRVPPAGKGHAKVQACVATTPVGHCLFGFCPDLGFVIGCTLDPHCLAAVGPCSVDLAGTAFDVPPGHRLRLGKVGRHRVVLRCTR
jgi:hypothetical protein